MPIAFAIIPPLVILLWLLAIRPYCLRNRKGYTPGANVGITLWVDWQEARELARSKGDDGMIWICRVQFWLQVMFFGNVLWMILAS